MNNPDVRTPQARPLEPDPPTAPGVIGILLSERASRRLLEAGEYFLLAARPIYPAERNRVAIYLCPCDLKTAQDASNVAMGKARSVRIKPAKPTSPAPSAPPAFTP